MPIQKTRADGLGFYLTGSNGKGGSQPGPAHSLGNYRSRTEATCYGFRWDDEILKELVGLMATASCSSGEASVRGDGAGYLHFTAPGGSEGIGVSIADGETKLLEDGGDGNKAIRVMRKGSTSVLGAHNLHLSEAVNNVIGGPDLDNTARAAGANKYRALMLRAHGDYGVNGIDLWIATLGTQRVSDAGQLGAAGTGTIQTTGSFADWPGYGFCQVRTAAGAMREIVYYTSRTATVLTISAAGHRELLGTTAAAGAGTDTVDAVPGIRIALEAPDSDGKIQHIANEDTAPGGVSWNTSITQAAGLNVGTLDVSDDYGLWIHRQFPAAGNGASCMRNVINVSYKAATAV